MKITLYIIIVCFTSCLISCRNNKRSDYFVKINYLNRESKIDMDLRDGVVGLDFIDYFSNDSLKIKVDNKRFLNTVISTDEISGGALLVKIDSLKKMNDLTIQLNSGAIANLKLDKDNQLFVVRYHNDTLNIKSISFIIPNR
jgi:hypothetical protein